MGTIKQITTMTQQYEHNEKNLPIHQTNPQNY